ncbi:hypothetical protein M2271_003123 [Streptomyces sp. LBL]|nr:hypothetical protein [Streptomyces sp. LBL]
MSSRASSDSIGARDSQYSSHSPFVITAAHSPLFEISVSSKRRVHVFDCFSCAIHRMAPICEHCRVQIIGQGVEVEGHWYCGAHDARAEGRAGIVDKV